MQQTPTPGLKENRSRGSKTFPCAVYQILSEQAGPIVKLHWHEEVELLYFAGGNYRLTVNMETYELHSECFFFINPGELHQIMLLPGKSHVENAIVFDIGILRFDTLDTGQIQILSPLQSGALLFPRMIPKEHPAFSRIYQAFSESMSSVHLNMQLSTPDNLESSALSAYEQLFLKSSLLRILAVLADASLFTEKEAGYDQRIETIKSALTYIHQNYQEKIYIHDLADLVGMNEQYFCRFFRKAVGQSPMEYVNAYRIRKAVHLLKETQLPITEVCLECGFNNLGNFMREFRKQQNTTPLQFRKNNSSDRS